MKKIELKLENSMRKSTRRFVIIRFIRPKRKEKIKRLFK